jgi:hypothetical protein
MILLCLSMQFISCSNLVYAIIFLCQWFTFELVIFYNQVKELFESFVSFLLSSTLLSHCFLSWCCQLGDWVTGWCQKRSLPSLTDAPEALNVISIYIFIWMMSTHFYSCRHLLGLQVQRFIEQQQVSLKWITQGLSNSWRKRSKLSLSNNAAITIQKVSCVSNTPNTLVRCIGALVRWRDSEIQAVVMIMSSNCNMK